VHESLKLRLGAPPTGAGRRVALLLLLGLGALLSTFRLAPVRGASMEPTLENGQLLCYQILPAVLHTPERGKVVVFHSPIVPDQCYVKRLVGLPGDELRFENGGLFVNGKPLSLPAGAVPEGYVLSARVPKGCFFALGDHGSVSYDSRRFGPVPLKFLIGPGL